MPELQHGSRLQGFPECSATRRARLSKHARRPEGRNVSGCCWVLGAAIMNTEASADKHAVDLNFSSHFHLWKASIEAAHLPPLTVNHTSLYKSHIVTSDSRLESLMQVEERVTMHILICAALADTAPEIRDTSQTKIAPSPKLIQAQDPHHACLVTAFWDRACAALPSPRCAVLLETA